MPIISDFTITQGEKLHAVSKVWALDNNNLWIIVSLSIINYFLPITIIWKIVIFFLLLWIGIYTVIQRWRLSLTNKRIIARRLYPRPFTLFSNSYNFPMQHIEGFSKGPKANILGFMIGLLIATNLGINSIKSSYAHGIELPDSFDFLLYFMKAIPYLKPDSDYIESQINVYYNQLATNFVRIFGFSALLIGLGLILVSYPWRETLVIRVRYASDFKIKASIPGKFIRLCYSLLYENEIAKPPKRYKKWKYTWFKDEKIDGIADLDQNLYVTRVISSFALIFTIISSLAILRDIKHLNVVNLIIWIIVTLADLLTIVYGIVFSKYTHEMVITNFRIIFAQEMSKISGIIGKRFFFISDLKRDDIAGFEFSKIHSLNLENLFISLFFGITSIFFSVALGSWVPTLFLLTSIFFLFLINQTYIKFLLKTKSGDQWVMRHQLANPLTTLRRFIGDETSILGRLLTNRLEEKEIIQIVQIMRSRDLKLPIKNFGMTMNRAMSSYQKFLRSEQRRQGLIIEEIPSQPVEDTRGWLRKKFGKYLRLNTEDLLLVNEKVVWNHRVPLPLAKKRISLLIGSIVILLSFPIMLIPAKRLKINSVTNEFTFSEIDIMFIPIAVILCIITISMLWIRYYTIRYILVKITPYRIFLEQVRQPPRIFFILGINRENVITESMLKQIQNIETRHNYVPDHGLQQFKEYGRKILLAIPILCILMILDASSNQFFMELPSISTIKLILYVLITFTSVKIVWSLGNLFIELIQAFPTLTVHASGIGIDLEIPYLDIEKAMQGQKIFWTGVNTGED